MKFEATEVPSVPPPPPKDIQITLDRDSAERLRAMVGKSTTLYGNDWCNRAYSLLGQVLYGATYAKGKYTVKQSGNIEVVEK